MIDKDSPLWRVLGALPSDQAPKKSGSDSFKACCPAHEDRHASLSIGTGLNGRVLLKCFKGCTSEAIVAALGLNMSDLFEKSPAGNPIRRFKLINPNGKVVATHVREDVPGDKDMWWESQGKRTLNGTPLESLPLYRLPDVLNAEPSVPVIVCEGEKAADALADIGLLAVGTVTGASCTPCEASIAALAPHEVWLWPDNDEPGRTHMQHIAERIDSAVRWIEWPTTIEGGDAADYVVQGGTAAGVVELLKPDQKPLSAQIRIWRGDELARAQFDPVRWAIPGILPSGLTILAGRPKLGKSWLVLGWSLDIARRAKVLRQIETDHGDTLYLALEDNDRRMQERQAMMLGDAGAPHGFHVANEWPRSNEGGLELIEQWIDTNKSARLVVIDTFKRFRPKESKANRLYDLDYDAIAPVSALAAKKNVAIVVVFHTNKLDPSDPIDLVSGTLGLSGAADGILVLKRERGQADASLFVTGRDVEEKDLALKWEKDDALGWALLGAAEDFRRSRERQAILDAVRAMPGMSPSDIANAIQKKPGAVRYLLFAMVRDAEVRNRDGKYFVLDTTPNTPNTNNANSLPVPPLSLTRVSADSAVSPNSGVRGVRGGDEVLDKPPVMCSVCGNELWPHEEAAGKHEECR